MEPKSPCKGSTRSDSSLVPQPVQSGQTWIRRRRVFSWCNTSCTGALAQPLTLNLLVTRAPVALTESVHVSAKKTLPQLRASSSAWQAPLQARCAHTLRVPPPASVFRGSDPTYCAPVCGRSAHVRLQGTAVAADQNRKPRVFGQWKFRRGEGGCAIGAGPLRLPIYLQSHRIHALH
jgi:hypothetical protein